jgi:hypothetical protein
MERLKMQFSVLIEALWLFKVCSNYFPNLESFSLILFAFVGQGSLILFDLREQKKLFTLSFPNPQFLKWITSDLLLLITPQSVSKISLNEGIVEPA